MTGGQAHSGGGSIRVKGVSGMTAVAKSMNLIWLRALERTTHPETFTFRPFGRRRRRGVASAPPKHLPGGQRLRSGAGGPCEPAGATSEYSKARASPLSPARRVSLTTPPPPGSGVHRAYKMAAGRAPARLSLWPERWVTPWPGSGPLGLLRAARCESPPPHGRAPAPHTPTPPQDRSGDPERPPRAAASTIPTPWGPGRASQT